MDDEQTDRPEDPTPVSYGPPPPTPPAGTARVLLTVAGAVISLEALALVAIAVGEASLLDATSIGLGIGTAVFFGLYGVVLLAGVNRVLKGYAWARGLLVFSQLMQLLLSYNFRGDVWWIPATLALSALVALGCLLSPPVTRALSRDQTM